METINLQKYKIIQGDALKVLKTLPDESVDMIMTSPPYWALRDYGVAGQLGLESTFQEYINKLCDIFDEVKRVLKKEGTCWVNIGDTYGGTSEKTDNDFDPKNPEGRNIRGKAPNSKIMPKSLVQVPSRFAIEMTNRGWILRNEIIWHKPNCMPSSADDRFTVDFEKIFFFAKNKKYFFEQQLDESIWADKDYRSKIEGGVKSGGKTATGKYATNKVAYSENGMKNKRTVWRINTKGYEDAHFATYPEELCVVPIKAGCPQGGGPARSVHGLGDHLESRFRFRPQRNWH